jgi:hypothetical protein
MSILNDNGEGSKGRSYPYRSKVLKGLQKATDNTAGLLGVLTSILNATVAHQDMEILLVRDEGVSPANPNGDLVVQQIREYDETTQTWSTSYTDVSGAPYIPVGPLEYLDPSAVLNLMLTEMLDQGLTLDSIDTTTANTLIELLAQGLTLDTINTSTAASLVELLAQGLSLDAIVTSTGLSATEATLLLTNALLTTIDADTSNLDVALSTVATEATLALILGGLTTMADNIDKDTWDTTIGNTKVFSYYGGAGAGHPASSTTEVETIEFREAGGATLVFTQTFTYDAANNVLTIVVT